MTAEGPTRVLRFTDARLASSSSIRQRKRLAGIAEPSPQPVAAAAAAAAAASSSSGGGRGGVSLEASVRLAGVGVSVIDSYPRELLYLTVGDIALDYLREGQSERVRANIGK
ncbi:unnamed protein product, partial [Ectocarpus sp. 12 AP-2014]